MPMRRIVQCVTRFESLTSSRDVRSTFGGHDDLRQTVLVRNQNYKFALRMVRGGRGRCGRAPAGAQSHRGLPGRCLWQVGRQRLRERPAFRFLHLLKRLLIAAVVHALDLNDAAVFPPEAATIESLIDGLQLA